MGFSETCLISSSSYEISTKTILTLQERELLYVPHHLSIPEDILKDVDIASLDDLVVNSKKPIEKIDLEMLKLKHLPPSFDLTHWVGFGTSSFGITLLMILLLFLCYKTELWKRLSPRKRKMKDECDLDQELETLRPPIEIEREKEKVNEKERKKTNQPRLDLA